MNASSSVGSPALSSISCSAPWAMILPSSMAMSQSKRSASSMYAVATRRNPADELPDLDLAAFLDGDVDEPSGIFRRDNDLRGLNAAIRLVDPVGHRSAEHAVKQAADLRPYLRCCAVGVRNAAPGKQIKAEGNGTLPAAKADTSRMPNR